MEEYWYWMMIENKIDETKSREMPGSHGFDSTNVLSQIPGIVNAATPNLGSPNYSSTTTSSKETRQTNGYKKLSYRFVFQSA